MVNVMALLILKFVKKDRVASGISGIKNVKKLAILNAEILMPSTFVEQLMIASGT